MDSETAATPPGPIVLRTLRQVVRIEFDDPAIGACLEGNFGAMMVAPSPSSPDFAYTIQSFDGSFRIARIDTGAVLSANGFDELVHGLEKDLTVELQRRRRDLFFLHAAAVEWRGAAVVLAADSGSGKSTTTWALLHHGFRYMSDELSPIDLANLQVSAYPHALCLKQPPPAPYTLPPSAMHLGRTIHTPAASLPEPPASESVPLGAVFLVRHDPDLRNPVLRRLGTAEASARIYLTALNALAHPDRGLTAVVRIAESVPCFALATAELGQTSKLIRSAIERDSTCSSSNS